MNGASLRLRTALVGCGYWGRNYLRLLGELSSVELVGVAESEPRRRQELAAANPSIAVASSLEELIAGNGRIDAVVVATEATAHEPVIRAALEAGCHVLAEKPLTLKASAGEELCRLAESRGAILMVGHTFLFNTAVWRLRELIQESRVGRIYYLHASRTHLGPIREDVDAIWDLAAHDISMFDYLVGARPSTVSAVAADYLRPGRHDVAFITLQYPGGVLGHVQISWLDANKERRLAIVGERCRIVFDDL
ncbi:MAG TPA: Gfo/Idh/MocA family oxidoreductase, partial [Promineifilum sp.]|nr:Gfo/Idh/MocA family oxidoreductase [Promineifilum sp.]